MAELSGLRVAIIATDGVEEAELTEPLKALRDAGAQVEILAPDPGRIQAMRHDTPSICIDVDHTLGEVKPQDYDAVMLPGGALNADKLRMDADARAFVRFFDNAGRPIAVICHGPWLLVSTDLVKDRTLTSYYTIQDDIRNAGGHWVDREVVCDRNWISSRQPSDLPAFNREMIALFARALQAKEPALAGR